MCFAYYPPKIYALRIMEKKNCCLLIEEVGGKEQNLVEERRTVKTTA